MSGFTAPVGGGSVRFTIPNAFDDGEDDLIIEMTAYVAGPRGGRGEQLTLPAEYWAGILPKLAERSVA
jgi:hypothetical protein